MKTVKIRPFENEDVSQLVELLDIVFENWPHYNINGTPEEFWRWKYLENPILESSIMLGVDDESIIGCHHILYNYLYVNGEKILGSTSLDLAVHPDYRGQGLASKISVPNEQIAAERGLKLSYFITSNPILIKSFTMSDTIEKRRPRFPKPIKNYARIQDIDLQLEKIPMDNPFVLKTGWKILSGLNQVISKTPIITEEFTLKSIKGFNEDYQQFWEGLLPQYSFITNHDAEYMEWRYCSKILPEYLKTGAYDSQGNLSGIIIYTINDYNPDYPIGYIVDLLSLDSESSNVLINHACEYFDANDVNLVNFQQVEGHPDLQISSSYGFINGRITPHIFYNTYNEYKGMEKLSDLHPKKLHLTWGDHDALPTIKPKTL